MGIKRLWQALRRLWRCHPPSLVCIWCSMWPSIGVRFGRRTCPRLPREGGQGPFRIPEQHQVCGSIGLSWVVHRARNYQILRVGHQLNQLKTHLGPRTLKGWPPPAVLATYGPWSLSLLPRPQEALFLQTFGMVGGLTVSDWEPHSAISVRAELDCPRRQNGSRSVAGAPNRFDAL